MSENRRELETGIHIELDKGGTYGDYLHLDELLAAQRPVTTVHDEMLFIIQHHTSELWIKLLLHELDCAATLVRTDRLAESFKIFARVAHVQRMLFEQWAVLETMTPSEYAQFRDALGKSSGFQSYQYRALEFVLGNKDTNALKPHRHDPRIHAELATRLAAPSLYDEFLRHLARRGLPVPASHTGRDWTQPYLPSDEVEAAWLAVYRAPDTHWDLYQLGEELTDLEDTFRLWRFRHVTTVERIIGFKRGTGGTSGVGYLRKMLDVVLFPEIWRLRTDL